MDMGKQGQEEIEIQDSWIPKTPYKPILPKPPPIYAETDENQLSETYPPGFPPQPQINKVAACLKSMNCTEMNNYREAASTGKTATASDNVDTCMDTISGLENVSFADLLALANAASVASTGAAPQWIDGAAKGFFVSSSDSQIDGCRMESSAVGFPYVNPDFSLSSNTRLTGNGTQEKRQYDVPTSHQHPYDLNFPPETMANTISHQTISEFTPITPEKAIREKGKHLSEIQNLCTDESKNQEREEQGNEVAATGFSSDRLQSSKELPKHVTDSSLAVASASSMENHNPEGGKNDTELDKTPQQKRRRKKHRPKVITEGKPKRTPKPATPKPAGSKESPTGKRKYVRRKGINKDSTTLPAEASGESSDPKTLEPTKSSRRVLNFETEGQPRGENSTCKSTLNLQSEPQAQNGCDKESQSKSTLQLVDETEVMAENIQAGLAYDLSRPVNQVLKEYLSMPEGQAPSTPLPTNINPPRRRKRNAHSQRDNNKKGRGEVAGQNSQEDLAQIILQTDTQLLPRSPYDNSSTSTILTMERQARRPKRTRTTDQADTSSTNVNGIQYNILHAYQTMSLVNFPNIQRKKRTEKGQNCTTSSTSSSVTAPKNIVGQETASCQNDAKADPSAQEASYWNSTRQSNANGVPAILREAGPEVLQDKLQTFECITGLSQTERLTKKRSSVTTRVRDLASLSRFADCKMHPTYPIGQAPAGCDRQGLGNSQRSHTSIEAIVAGMQSTLARKKRTKKRNSLINPASSSAKEAQMHQKIILHGHHQFPAMPLGSPPDKIWNQLFSIDAISEQLRLLDINRDNHAPYQEQNALIPYMMGNQEQNALVLYRRDGTVVPFEGSFYPVRKRRPRPKVYLDDETNRVWKLLMGNINSEGIDGTDEEKAKWWEEERRVFRGRADSFIARMHLVQGDRRFSPWKGSVVDSVVGVFLTQNVSDHLSSSAFMSVAARFPLKSNSNNKPCHEELASSVTHEPVVYLVDSEDTISVQPVCNQSSIILHDTGNNEEQEIFNSDETSRSSSDFVSLRNESIGKLLNSLGGGSETYYDVERSTTDMRKIGTASLTGDCRATNEAYSSQDSVLSSQYSMDSTAAQTAERTGSCSESTLEGEDLTNVSKLNSLNCHTSFMELLQMAGSTMLQKVYGHGSSNVSSDANSKYEHVQVQTVDYDNRKQNVNDLSGIQRSLVGPIISSSSHFTANPGLTEVGSFEMFREEARSCDVSNNKDEYNMAEQNPLTSESMSQTTGQNKLTLSVREASRSSSENNQSSNSFQEDEDIITQSQTGMLGAPKTIFEPQNQVENNEMQKHINLPNQILDVTESSSALDNQNNTKQKTSQSNLKDQGYSFSKELNEMNGTTLKPKGRKVMKEKKDDFDWDSLRRQVEASGSKRERTANTMDSVDWEAVRCADVSDIANTIKERGMNNMLAERIRDFLNRLVREHGSIDLEWLRDIPPDKTKEYLLSIRGLGLKSVECVRLLTLHHLAFPVDTNVGRIAVRLGWVPLQPLPESLQLHLLEMYPVLESIQKYLWPRLCKLDQRTLYELHYQMITFGKVFCTKSKPNCNACPMRGECRHFASAFASARLSLPGPEERSIVSANENRTSDQNPAMIISQQPLPLTLTGELEGKENSEVKRDSEEKSGVYNNEPIIEEPTTPEPECAQALETDMEDAFSEDPDEIPTIKLNMEEFTQNLQNYMQENMELQDGDMSKALVAITAEAASIPTLKLKNVSRLRTEHQVYELPDSHPLLKGLNKREPDDPCSYLLAIWTPGEMADSIQPPDRSCSSQEHGKLCDEKTCFSCNSIREAESQIVRGTLLIPCRTAMRGSFPLNGTYFQVNEVFADHDSSLNPIDIPRHWIWHLPRRTVYFGTSIPTIFKGLTTEGIQHCFWRGYVCVRGFDQKTRAPRPLMARLHFPASKLSRTKAKADADDK